MIGTRTRWTIILYKLVNIGTGCDYSIAELAETIASVIGYKGEICWDTSMPDGSLQKLLDVSKMTKIGWRPHTSLVDGLAKTYEWYGQCSSLINGEQFVKLHEKPIDRPSGMESQDGFEVPAYAREFLS